jgi:hypothetical protein
MYDRQRVLLVREAKQPVDALLSMHMCCTHIDAFRELPIYVNLSYTMSRVHTAEPLDARAGEIESEGRATLCRLVGGVQCTYCPFFLLLLLDCTCLIARS